MTHLLRFKHTTETFSGLRACGKDLSQQIEQKKAHLTEIKHFYYSVPVFKGGYPKFLRWCCFVIHLLCLSGAKDILDIWSGTVTLVTLLWNLFTFQKFQTYIKVSAECVSIMIKSIFPFWKNRKTQYCSKIHEIFPHLWSRLWTKQQGGNGAEIADCWFCFLEQMLHTVYILFQTRMVYFKYNTWLLWSMVYIIKQRKQQYFLHEVKYDQFWWKIAAHWKENRHFMEKYVWDDFQLCRETFAQYGPNQGMFNLKH